MAYDVYFDKVLFPVAPSKISTKIKNKNKTIELINEGDVNVLKNAGLTELTFSLLLPNTNYPFAKYTNGFKNASYYLNILESLKVNKQPFQLIISRTLPTGRVLSYTQMNVSLEDYTIEDDVTEGFDNVVSIKLMQYKHYGTKTINVSTSSKATSQRASGSGSRTAGTTYTIVAGDTLWNIAKKKLGDGSKWKLIYEENKSIIESEAKKHGKASSSNGHWIYQNTKIKIPTTTSNSSSTTEKKIALEKKTNHFNVIM